MRIYLPIAGLVVLLLFTYACQTPADQHQLTYRITPFQEEGVPKLKVLTTFTPEKDGLTYLDYLNEAWGETNLFNALESVDVPLENVEILKNPDSNRIELKHPKNLDKLQISYVLKQDTEAPLTSEKAYRPIIQPTYFRLFTHHLLMIPHHLNTGPDIPLKVNFIWEVPEDYLINNSFASNEKNQQLSLTSEALGESFFAGGDFRNHTFHLKDNKVVLSLRGQWPSFTDAEISAVLKETLEAQRDFWQDHSQEYFTVSLLPTQEEMGSSMQGTGLTNSFATSASDNGGVSLAMLAWLFNHELMHNWIGHTIQNENEEQQYWFSEGFTEYYAYKNVSLNEIAGFRTADYVKEINKLLKNLQRSPVIDAPNAEINYDNFWSDRAYEKLPYYRGALFAFYLDQKIQKESNGNQSLDDMMRKMLVDAKEKNQKLTHQYFVETVNMFLAEDIQPFFEKHIEQGVPFDFPALFQELGLPFYTPWIRSFDKGFTEDEQRKVISVDVSSKAYKAGVRAGDQIKAIDMYHDPNKEGSLTLLRDGEMLEVSYFPSKELQITQLQEAAN